MRRIRVCLGVAQQNLSATADQIRRHRPSHRGGVGVPIAILTGVIQTLVLTSNEDHISGRQLISLGCITEDIALPRSDLRGHGGCPQRVDDATTIRVLREGFDAAAAYLTATFPDVPRERMLVGLEFAGHHGFTFAHDLARRGYQIVNVLPAVTKRTKEIEDNSPLKTDAKDAALICKLTGDGAFVRFPFLDELYP